MFTSALYLMVCAMYRIMEHAVKKGETIVKTAKTNVASGSGGQPGFFGDFGRFMEHLGNEIKKDVPMKKQ